IEVFQLFRQARHRLYAPMIHFNADIDSKRQVQDVEPARPSYSTAQIINRQSSGKAVFGRVQIRSD
ncbi:MAG TPA: hypothetical protein DIT99_26885, partial [Candidatus Latescibacteria bacterium]|nr:hypothetical protein [Candidatus Latescibacterota bacterium]